MVSLSTTTKKEAKPTANTSNEVFAMVLYLTASHYHPRRQTHRKPPPTRSLAVVPLSTTTYKPKPTANTSNEVFTMVLL